MYINNHNLDFRSIKFTALLTKTLKYYISTASFGANPDFRIKLLMTEVSMVTVVEFLSGAGEIQWVFVFQ